MVDVLVIGGGVAGMEAAGQLARSGYSVILAEKESLTGGHLKNWYHLFPDRRDGSEVGEYLNNLVKNSNIGILYNTCITGINLRKGKFTASAADGQVVEAEAVIVATGFDLFDSRRKEEYGYGIYQNVITSADLEKMFRTGSVRLADGSLPERVGFIHCVGSRDEKVGNLYCSKLCCITAVKQAMEVHEKIKGVKTFCFYMDMRMGGAYYEEIYREAQEKYGVSFIRGKVSEVSQNINGRLIIKAEDTLAGRPLKMELDIIVLMAGMEMSDAGELLAGNSSLRRGENRFFSTADNHTASNRSNLNGVFYAGACTAPMNITETISHARAAVTEVISFLREKKKRDE
ncbi:MAG: CoB--CoM heterodisulfide reductase iron-sulfur subunit A family protein [Bacteroidales bacterium]|nr:CoB--CoM heterodisulfide reductase iron-sulfur subunit A family protein [Bacteroidales bacterium]